MSSIDQKLKELGITLPDVNKPPFPFVPTRQTGNLIYTSGQDCREEGELVFEGKLGKDLTVEQGQQAACQSMINSLAAIKAQIGDLDKVSKIIKVLAFVNSAPGFVDQPYVINEASELLEKIFGEKGKHARSAIAANELPFNTPVEIEMIVEIKE